MLKTLTILLLISTAAEGATYYIDFDTGIDSNNGTAQATPWRSLPGSRNAANSGYVSTIYGGGTFTFNANKVPAGTIFKLKRGTSWTSSDGGWIQIDSLWYQNGTSGSPIIIQADSTWGSGSIIIDGSGMTMPNFRGLLNLDNIKYLVIDGVVSQGIIIRNTSWNGIRAFGTGVNGLILKNLEVYNGPVALVSVFSSDGATPQYFSGARLDNIMAHDTTGTDDTSSCIYGAWLDDFEIKNCTVYNSGTGADGIHVESSHYGWIQGCVAHNCGEQGIDLSRNGSFKTRDDSYYITVRECISYDNTVNNFDHNSGTHHITWLNNFSWRTTSGQLGDPGFNVHQGTAGPNWWWNCSSSKSMEGGFQVGWDSNPWSIPSGTYPQTYGNLVSSGDSTLGSARWGSILVEANVGGCSYTATIVNSVLNTTEASLGTVNYKGTAYTPSNVATGSGGFSGIGTGCLTNLSGWLTPNATTWNLNNETPGVGSVCINGGVWPFRTSGSGTSSSTLTVTNAYGMVVTNIFRAGDYIQVESGSVVQVASVSGAGTITLSSSTSWSSAKGVWFNYGGTSPLIGAGFPVASASPSISVSPSSLVNFGSVVTNTSSSSQNYTLSAANLTANLVITPPTDFEISTNDATWLTTSLTLVPVSGSVSSRQVFVRFSPLSAGAKSTSIVNSSTGATSQSVAVSGVGTIISVPSQVTGLVISPLSTTSIQSSWGTSSGATGYKVFDSGNVLKGPTASGVLTLVETGLVENTQYSRYVVATNSVGNASNSATVSKYTLVHNPIDADFAVTGASSSTISVIVTSIGTSGSTSCQVERSLNGTSGWLVVKSFTVSGYSFTDTGLSQATTYFFRFQYRNGDGVVTSYSPVESTTTLAATSQVTITSQPVSGFLIGVSKADTNELSNGTTAFTRIYTNNSIITFSAPVTSLGYDFQKWNKDGIDQGSSTNVNVGSITSNTSLITVYVLTPPPPPPPPPPLPDPIPNPPPKRPWWWWIVHRR